jgi:hypothetical protein
MKQCTNIIYSKQALLDSKSLVINNKGYWVKAVYLADCLQKYLVQ